MQQAFYTFRIVDGGTYNCFRLVLKEKQIVNQGSLTYPHDNKVQLYKNVYICVCVYLIHENK